MAETGGQTETGRKIYRQAGKVQKDFRQTNRDKINKNVDKPLSLAIQGPLMCIHYIHTLEFSFFPGIQYILQ